MNENEEENTCMVFQGIQRGESRIVASLRLAMATSENAARMTLSEARSFMLAYMVSMEASGTVGDTDRQEYIDVLLGKEV